MKGVYLLPHLAPSFSSSLAMYYFCHSTKIQEFSLKYIEYVPCIFGLNQKRGVAVTNEGRFAMLFFYQS